MSLSFGRVYFVKLYSRPAAEEKHDKKSVTCYDMPCHGIIKYVAMVGKNMTIRTRKLHCYFHAYIYNLIHRHYLAMM